MNFNNQKHHRRSIRLPGHDYSQPGAYFITTVTHGRECLFGEIRDGGMHLNDAGRIVWDIWNSLPARFLEITTGTAIVMPNHFHGILIINVGAIHVGAIHVVGAIHELPLLQKQRRQMTLPMVIGYFKMNTAKRINQILDSGGVSVWQRNYYEHIIRSDEEFHRIHDYIETNVDRWAIDDENPMRLAS